jgi:putative ABC transport system permease protein
VCADKDFLDVFNVKLKEGYYFTGNPGVDSLTVVVNSAFLKSMNLSDPLGKYIQIRDRGKEYKLKIIGVTEDFNFQSLHEKISPMIIGYRNSPFDYIDYYSSKVSMANIGETIKYLKSVHEKFDQGTPFEYNFLDDKIGEFYKRDNKEGTIINASSLISILIACLGLFGLASYSAQQKIKEIGIRKVLGASVPGITVLFSKEFLMLAFWAAVIAIPPGLYFMNKWLESFAYRIHIGAPEILLSAISAILISVVTISYQAIKSANTNPVEVIRNE